VRLALDTNILVYAEGLNGAAKRAAILGLLTRLPQESALVPVQVLGELYNVLIRKAGLSRKQARSAVLRWRDAFLTVETSASLMLAAIDLAVDHRLGIWDAVILSAAAEAECRLLLSEDLQEGFTWKGVTVVNPFAPVQHPLLQTIFGD
jgi:predicted nucleic acid-binding protein